MPASLPLRVLAPQPYHAFQPAVAHAAAARQTEVDEPPALLAHASSDSLYSPAPFAPRHFGEVLHNACKMAPLALPLALANACATPPVAAAEELLLRESKMLAYDAMLRETRKREHAALLRLPSDVASD